MEYNKQKTNTLPILKKTRFFSPDHTIYIWYRQCPAQYITKNKKKNRDFSLSFLSAYFFFAGFSGFGADSFSTQVSTEYLSVDSPFVRSHFRSGLMS